MKHILEIGYSGSPLGYFNLEAFLSAKPSDSTYHGTDLPNHRMHSAEELLIVFFRGESKDLSADIRLAESDYRKLRPHDISLSRMDAQQLAFRDSLFHEVHMHYVLSQPDITGPMMRNMIQESYRVLVPSGTLIVTGEDEGTAFRECSVLEPARQTIRTAGFSERPQSALEGDSIYSRTVRSLLEIRGKAAKPFLLIGRK